VGQQDGKLRVQDILVVFVDYFGNLLEVLSGDMFRPGGIGAEANAKISRLVMVTFQYVQRLDTSALQDLHRACEAYLSPPPVNEWEQERHHFVIPAGLVENVLNVLGLLPLNLVVVISHS